MIFEGAKISCELDSQLDRSLNFVPNPVNGTSPDPESGSNFVRQSYLNYSTDPINNNFLQIGDSPAHDITIREGNSSTFQDVGIRSEKQILEDIKNRVRNYDSHEDSGLNLSDLKFKLLDFNSVIHGMESIQKQILPSGGVYGRANGLGIGERDSGHSCNRMENWAMISNEKSNRNVKRGSSASGNHKRAGTDNGNLVGRSPIDLHGKG